MLSVAFAICVKQSYAQTDSPVSLPDTVSDRPLIVSVENLDVLTPQMLDGRQLLYEENNGYISHEYHFTSDGIVEEYNFDYDYEHDMRYLVSTVTRRYEIKGNDIFIVTLKPEDDTEEVQVIDHFRYSLLRDEITRVY